MENIEFLSVLWMLLVKYVPPTLAGGVGLVPFVNWVKDTFKLSGKEDFLGYDPVLWVVFISSVVGSLLYNLVLFDYTSPTEADVVVLIGTIFATSQVWYRYVKSRVA